MYSDYWENGVGLTENLKKVWCGPEVRITLQAKTILGPIALSCPSVVVMLSPLFESYMK